MKKIVVAGDLYIFQHDLEKYISHCNIEGEIPSLPGFITFVMLVQKQGAK